METTEKWFVKRCFNEQKGKIVTNYDHYSFLLRFNRNRTQTQCKNVLRHSASGGFDARSLTAQF